MRWLLLLGLVGGLGAGCKSPCRQLSEKLCECTLNSVDKDNCLRRVQNEEARIPTTDEDETTCEALLAGCDCHLVHTTEGKERCGLARPRPTR